MYQLRRTRRATQTLTHYLAAVTVLGSLFFSACFADERVVQAEVTTIPGFRAPEDIDVLMDDGALIVSGYSATENGDLRIFHPGAGKIELVYVPGEGDLATANTLAWGASTCPGPPPGFAPHGIHVSKNAIGSYTLLAVNHTGRESVEWFEVRKVNSGYKAVWRGCVIVDEPYWINDVAMLPDGGFVASHMMPRDRALEAFQREPNDGIKSGYVIEWQQGSGWNKVPGTEGALPNGIQVSSDGAVVYSNHYLGNGVVAVERASGKRVWTTAVEGAPDNLSITSDGRLLAVTHLANIATIGDCISRPEQVCNVGFRVYWLDAMTGRVQKVLSGGNANFGGATVAIEVGDSVYLGSATGEWIGRVPAR